MEFLFSPTHLFFPLSIGRTCYVHYLIGRERWREMSMCIILHCNFASPLVRLIYRTGLEPIPASTIFIHKQPKHLLLNYLLPFNRKPDTFVSAYPRSRSRPFSPFLLYPLTSTHTSCCRDHKVTRIQTHTKYMRTNLSEETHHIIKRPYETPTFTIPLPTPLPFSSSFIRTITTDKRT